MLAPRREAVDEKNMSTLRVSVRSDGASLRPVLSSPRGGFERMEGAGKVLYARREGVVLREVAGEHILVPIRRDVADLQAIFALNRVGLRIWELLDGERDLDGILAELLERFEVTAEEASADLHSFVERLHAAGLVEQKG